MRRRVVLALGATMLIGVLAGCSSSNGTSAGGTAQAGPDVPAQQHSTAANGAAGGSAGGTASGQTAQSGQSGQAGALNLPSVATGRQVIRTATVAVTTKDVSGAASRAATIAQGAGGYLSAENVDGDSASVTLSVPQAQLDSVLAAVAKLGTVTSQQQSSQDVTDQLVDVSSRIATQQASVDRVRQLLAQATSVSDIVQIEGELTTREADLESMEHQQAELAGQVAMSTVTVQISRVVASSPAAQASAPGFGSGIAGGWHAFLATLRVFVLVLGAALPFLLGIGIPALVIWWLIRRRRIAKAS